MTYTIGCRWMDYGKEPFTVQKETAKEVPYLPWQGEHACKCSGAGEPCPRCNPSDKDAPPRLPRGFEIDDG